MANYNDKTSGLNEYILYSKTKNIYTVDREIPKVESLRIRGTYIVDSGDLSQVKWRTDSSPAKWDQHTTVRIVEIPPDSVVVPGFIDAHTHIMDYGVLKELSLRRATSVEEVIHRIKRFLLSRPDVLEDKTRWIHGIGWDHCIWPGENFPTAEQLSTDPLLHDRLIFLQHIDCHAAWVSLAVLKLIGDMPDKIEGGIIIRDSAGKPTGVFIDNAVRLIPLPPRSESAMIDHFNEAMSDALKCGITGMHDAACGPETIEIYRKQADAGAIPLRLHVMGFIDSEEYWGDKIPRLVNYGKHGRLNVRSIKLFADGMLGTRGAALNEPYADQPSSNGLMQNSPATLLRLVEAFRIDGWQVNIHCVGDHACKEVLDIFESVISDCEKKVDVDAWRPRIEHAQIVTPFDMQRLGRLGVIPCVQPAYIMDGMWWAENRIGKERLRNAYAYQTMIQNTRNHILPLGSDFPVSDINPLAGFYAAVTRLSANHSSPDGPGGWFPEQCLTRTQALKGLTLDAAYATFSERETGSLVPGKRADFVILNKDIMTIPYHEILKTNVLATVIDGRFVYGEI